MFGWCRHIFAGKGEPGRVGLDCLTRLDRQGLNSLQDHLGNAVSGIERERKIAAVAMKDTVQFLVRAGECLCTAAAAQTRIKEHPGHIRSVLRGTLSGEEM